MFGTDTLILWIVASLAAVCASILVLLARAILRRSPQTAHVQTAKNRRTRRELGLIAMSVVAVAVVAVPLARLVYLRTIRATGKMWHWTYEYPDYGNLSFDVPMLEPAVVGKANDIVPPAGEEHLVLPVGKTVRLVSVGTNLFYSWSISSIGASITGLPGRTNESWFRADKEGIYYGQPSELCALLHTFKPVEVEVVSRERFDRWVAGAGGKSRSVARSERAVTAAE
jgi:cytochrome c oxidase subunit 2